MGDLINARNCYIALVSEDGQALEFPYYVDEQGSRASAAHGPGLTEYVLRTRKAAAGEPGRGPMSSLRARGSFSRRPGPVPIPGWACRNGVRRGGRWA